MTHVDRMIDEIIRREGGYVNHPADRGGPTNHGVTQATLTAWRRRPVTADDVRALTAAEAAEIYRANYYFTPKLDRLPEEIQAQVFDIAVNAGPATAIKMVQRVVGSPADGVIGPATLRAITEYVKRNQMAMFSAQLALERLKHYAAICNKNSSQRTFLLGWVNRLLEFA